MQVQPDEVVEVHFGRVDCCPWHCAIAEWVAGRRFLVNLGPACAEAIFELLDDVSECQ